MPKQYRKSDWIFYKDIKRCPHSIYSDQYKGWIKDDDKRLELIALERYAEYITMVATTGNLIKKDFGV